MKLFRVGLGYSETPLSYLDQCTNLQESHHAQIFDLVVVDDMLELCYVTLDDYYIDLEGQNPTHLVKKESHPSPFVQHK
jgi:hypothetical protein